MTAAPSRRLTGHELLVLKLARDLWGHLNRADAVTFVEGDAWLFVQAPNRTLPVALNLTNLGGWYATRQITFDDLVEHVLGPAASAVPVADLDLGRWAKHRYRLYSWYLSVAHYLGRNPKP